MQVAFHIFHHKNTNLLNFYVCLLYCIIVMREQSIVKWQWIIRPSSYSLNNLILLFPICKFFIISLRFCVSFWNWNKFELNILKCSCNAMPLLKSLWLLWWQSFNWIIPCSCFVRVDDHPINLIQLPLCNF